MNPFSFKKSKFTLENPKNKEISIIQEVKENYLKNKINIPKSNIKQN